MQNTNSNKNAARGAGRIKIFVRWAIDDMGEWKNERRVETLDEARQLLANAGCAGPGELTRGNVFFGDSWKVGLSRVIGEISIAVNAAARKEALDQEAAKPLPSPAAEVAAEYAARRGKVSPPPTAEELADAEARDLRAMQDETLRQKDASYKNYPA